VLLSELPPFFIIDMMHSQPICDTDLPEGLARRSDVERIHTNDRHDRKPEFFVALE
jgi:hypothetical protein